MGNTDDDGGAVGAIREPASRGKDGEVAGGVSRSRTAPQRDVEKGNAADSADEDGVAADGVDEQGVRELEGFTAELLCAVDVAECAGLGESNDLRDPCSAVPDVELGDADEGADRAAERTKASRSSSVTASAQGRDDGAANSR